jgi:hypothetical protein
VKPDPTLAAVSKLAGILSPEEGEALEKAIEERRTEQRELARGRARR